MPFVAVLRDRNAIRWPIDLLPIAPPRGRSSIMRRLASLQSPPPGGRGAGSVGAPRPAPGGARCSQRDAVCLHSSVV